MQGPPNRLAEKLIWIGLFVPSGYALGWALHLLMANSPTWLFGLVWFVLFIPLLAATRWVASLRDRPDPAATAAAVINLVLWTPGVPEDVIVKCGSPLPKVRLPSRPDSLLESIPRTRDPLVQETIRVLRACMQLENEFDVESIIVHAPELGQLREALLSQAQNRIPVD